MIEVTQNGDLVLPFRVDSRYKITAVYVRKKGARYPRWIWAKGGFYSSASMSYPDNKTMVITFKFNLIAN